MKNIFRFLAAAAIAVTAVSCDLTLYPEDAESPEVYFKSEAHFEQWTNYLYSGLLDSPDAVSRYNADDMVDKSMGDIIQGLRLASDSMSGNNEWDWDMLRRINYMLEHSSNCEDEALRTKYDGIAYFFRAYFYFQKVMRFGDVPYYDKVLESTDEAFLNKARDDRGFVMDKVMDDFDKAIDMIPATKDGFSARVTKWAALAMKSRAALFEGTWRKYHNMPDAEKYLSQAVAAAKTFIEESGYVLYNQGEEPYRDLFCSDRSKTEEVVLARLYQFETLNISNSVQFNIRNDAQGFTRRFMNHYLMADGSRFTDISGHETMFYTEETKNRDPRMAQTVLCPGYIIKEETKTTPNDMTSLTGYEPIKFVASTAHSGASKGTMDWPLIRAAEVYLNYAEAKAELASLGLATLEQADLDMSVNKIRQRAKMPILDMAVANADVDPFLASCYPKVEDGANKGVILEIRRERTIELVNEGFRQWDMLRWKEGEQMVNSAVVDGKTVSQPYYGIYFPAEGLYDMDGDGKNDLEIYSTVQQSKPSDGLTVKKIGSDFVLSEGTYGYVVAWATQTWTWNDREYLWPIPADQRVLTGGALTQNPGWTDSTNFN